MEFVVRLRHTKYIIWSGSLYSSMTPLAGSAVTVVPLKFNFPARKESNLVPAGIYVLECRSKIQLQFPSIA
jgi:hypothetical protein